MENKQQSNGDTKENNVVKKKLVSDFPKSSVNTFLFFAIWGVEAESNYLETI